MIKPFHNTILKLLRSRKYFDIQWILRTQVFLYNILLKSNYGIFKICQIADLSPISRILIGYRYRSKTQNDIEVTVPDLNFYIIENALINSRSSAIIKGKKIYYESINNNERFNEGFVRYHSKKYAQVDLSNIEFIDEGFFLAGNGSYNWYHWMLEILPKMIYFNQEITKVILVDESVKQIPSMIDSLRIFTKNLNVKIFYLDSNKSYRVKKLFFINEINKIMFNALNSDLNYPPLYYYRQETLKNFREKFLEDKNIKKINTEKIYLERKSTHRIAKNESEMSRLMQKHEFKGVDLVGLKIEDQINLFNSAKFLIGTTGAAWTNILFCENNTKCIIFMPRNYNSYQFYSELADLLQIKVKYLFYENGEASHEKSDFVIDLHELENLLATLYE